MSCTKTYGVSFHGYDNYTYDHPDYPKLSNEQCGPNNYFPTPPLGDTGLYICNQEDTTKIFKRLHCGQKVIPEYRPGFEICRNQVNKNTVQHPQIDMINPCNDLQNSFTPCKGDGLGYLKRVLVDSELKNMNQYLSRVHETSVFVPKKLPTNPNHQTYYSVAKDNLGPHGVCGPLTINKCTNYPYKKECEPHGLISLGEGEKPTNRQITTDASDAYYFLSIGPKRCEFDGLQSQNHCEMTWDNVTKRHYKVAIPNYIKPDNQYKPQEYTGYPVPCPPVCKYDYTCIN
jgi:hypothetical protein